MKTILFFYMCLLLFLSCFSCSENAFSKKPPVAINGVLDLVNWNFEKDGIVSLSGEWEFYPEKLLTEKDFHNSLIPIQPSFVTIPMLWNNQIINGKQISNFGYATFRLKILNCNESGLFLKFFKQESSYKVFADEKFLFESGVVNKDKQSSKSGYNFAIKALPESNKEVSLIVQISNFHYLLGGFTYPFLLGNDKDILRKHDHSLFMDFFISGSFFIMGFYYLGIFWQRKKEKSSLYFGVFCLLLSIRSIVTGEYFLHNFFPVDFFDPLLRIDFLTIYLSNPIFILYIYNIFPDETNLLFKKILLVTSFALTLIIIFLPPIYSRSTLTLMHFIILLSGVFTILTVIKAIKNKREGGKSFLFGSIIFILFIVNDILNTQFIIRTGLYAPVGFFIFIFSQSYILSYRSARTYLRIEELSKDLEKKNFDLSTLSTQLSSANTKLTHILKCSKIISSIRNKQLIYLEGYRAILTELKWYNKSSLTVYLQENAEDLELNQKIYFTGIKLNDQIQINLETNTELPVEENLSQFISAREIFFFKECLIIPIIYNETLHCLFSITGISEDSFTIEDRKYVQTIAESLAITLSNLDYLNEQKEKIRMEMELHTASIVQNALFPSSPPKIKGLDIFGMSKTASEIGGDWFGFGTKNKDYLYIFIGDVTGHGSAAGLITSAIYSIVKQTENNCIATNTDYTPVEWNNLLNQVVYDMGIEDYYMTFLTLRISLLNGEMFYSNAAHCNPIILRENRIDLLNDSASLFFGLDKNLAFDQGKFQLKKNDLLFLYTDGLFEARNEEGEMFGLNRIQNLLFSSFQNNSKQISENVYSELVKYKKGIPIQDDVTLLVLKVLEDF